jgi:hypothetical protein
MNEATNGFFRVVESTLRRGSNAHDMQHANTRKEFMNGVLIRVRRAGNEPRQTLLVVMNKKVHSSSSRR